MLEVEKIDTYYGEYQALRQVSLRVHRGEFVSIFGANGHGKSTLLKAICGLLRPKAGSIKFNSMRIDNLPPQKIVAMGLVYIAEDRHLFPEMTVLENLKLGAYNRSARHLEGERLEYVYQLFPKLRDMRKRLAATLSGGEARMLAIGRGLMSSAQCLAIDEPSLGLAPNIRSEVFEKTKEINKDGTTVILAEQSIASQALDLADRIYVMEDGQIVFEGTKAEAMANDQLRSVFLGR